jgi:hypothetical protein
MAPSAYVPRFLCSGCLVNSGIDPGMPFRGRARTLDETSTAAPTAAVTAQKDMAHPFSRIATSHLSADFTRSEGRLSAGGYYPQKFAKYVEGLCPEPSR